MEIARKVEPFAPSPLERFKAMGVLSMLGIPTGITMMPILPYIEDSEENIVDIVRMSGHYGAKFIYPAFAVTLRDRQRAYYYNALDEKFPGIRQKYEKRFGTRYGCSPQNVSRLKKVFQEACRKYGVSTQVPTYRSKISSVQLSLFDNEF